MTASVESDTPVIAAAIIVNGGRVLMVRRKVSEGQLSWQFPAGAVEVGEESDAAAAREAKEETGVDVRPVTILGERVHPATGRTMVYVACEHIAGEAVVADADELDSVAWCDRQTLAAYVPYPLFEPVQDYLDGVLT